MFIRIISTIFIGLSLFSAAVTSAQDTPMKLESAVQLLKPAEGDGQEPQLLDAKNVVPGDTLVFTTSFRNQGRAAVNDFVIVNPVPADVVLAEAPSADAQVSVDGAKTWGRLADLRVVESSGEERAATVGDITHLRWAFSEVPSGETGRVQFNATVR